MFIILFLTTLFKYDIRYVRVRKKILKKFVLLGTLCSICLIYILKNRYEAVNINISNINTQINPMMQINLHHILFDILGNTWGFAFAQFSAYLSHGYYGLSMALQLPFKWTYFVGNSYSLTVFLNKFLGIPVDYHNTYPYRLGEISPWNDSKWSTVFPWYASDFTFIGTLFIFMLIAYLYAKVWKEAYLYSNPISIVLFIILTIGFIYMPANNQLLHSPGSFIATFFFLFLWIVKHKKYNFIRL